MLRPPRGTSRRLAGHERESTLHDRVSLGVSADPRWPRPGCARRGDPARYRSEDMLEEIFPDPMRDPAPARLSPNQANAAITKPAIANVVIANPTTPTATVASTIGAGGAKGRDRGPGSRPTRDTVPSGGDARGASDVDAGARPAWEMEVLVPPASGRWRGPVRTTTSHR
jgi:hypothetical protein